MKLSRTFRLTTNAQGTGVYTDESGEKLALSGGGLITPFLKNWFLHKLEFINPITANKLYVSALLKVVAYERDNDKETVFQHKVTSSDDVPEGPHRLVEPTVHWNGSSLSDIASSTHFTDYQPDKLKITIANDSGTPIQNRYIDVVVIISTNEAGCHSTSGIPKGFK